MSRSSAYPPRGGEGRDAFAVGIVILKLEGPPHIISQVPLGEAWHRNRLCWQKDENPFNSSLLAFFLLALPQWALAII